MDGRPAGRRPAFAPSSGGLSLSGHSGLSNGVKSGMRRSDLSRAFQTFQKGTGSRGPRALLTAVIATAALDVAAGDQGAARYFLSDLYRHHIELVGLSADYLPDGVTLADLAALVEGQASRRPRSTSQNDTKCHRVKAYGA